MPEMSGPRVARIVLVAVLLVSGCNADVDTAPPITVTSSASAPMISVEASGSPGPPAAEFATPTTDEAWSDITISARFCGIDDTVQLSAGDANARSTTWGEVQVHAYPDNAALNGAAGSLVAKQVMCANFGGTASGDIAYAYLLFKVDGPTTRILAELPAQQPRLGEHPTMVTSISGSGETFTVDESWYKIDDANCCPSGRAQTDWRVTESGADKVSTRVTG